MTYNLTTIPSAKSDKSTTLTDNIYSYFGSEKTIAIILETPTTGLDHYVVVHRFNNNI